VLPLIFGPQYEETVGFVRALCFVLVPYAAWTVGAEALGASANHGLRAVLMNASILGVVVIAVMTYLFTTTGTIAAIYMVDIALAAAFWWIILTYPAGRAAPARAGDGGAGAVGDQGAP
jgi:O-antigen/teichoic acid export membrane protein